MIDAHCHLQKDGLEATIEAAKQRGIERFVVNGTCENDWPEVARLARAHNEILPCFGLHPWFVKDRSPKWQTKLESWLEEFPEAGVGEIGLDRWIKDYDIEDQLSVFESQWQIAVAKGRPVTVHCLKAWGALESSLQQLPSARFLLHSYSGSAEMVPGFVKHGAWFSISGYFLKPEKAAKLNVFDAVPSDRLLLETDAPDMALPEPLDLYPEFGNNHPGNLEVVYQEIAKRRQIPPGKLVKSIKTNFDHWFTTQPSSSSGGGLT